MGAQGPQSLQPRPCSHLAPPQAAVQLLALQELLHLGLDQHPAHVDHLLHGQGQALHGVAELLWDRGGMSHRAVAQGMVQSTPVPGQSLRTWAQHPRTGRLSRAQAHPSHRVSSCQAAMHPRSCSPGVPSPSVPSWCPQNPPARGAWSCWRGQRWIRPLASPPRRRGQPGPVLDHPAAGGSWRGRSLQGGTGRPWQGRAARCQHC